MKNKFIKIFIFIFVFSLFTVNVYAGDSIIEAWITDMATVGFDGTFFSSMTSTLETFNPTVTAGIVNLAKTTTVGVGSGLLGIFLLMELVGIVQRMDGGGGSQSGINIPASFLIRFIIYIFLYSKYNVIMKGIEAICVSLTSNIAAGSSVVNPPYDVSSLVSTFNSLNLLSKAMCCIGTMLMWFANWIIRHVVSIFVAFRMFQLWMMTLFAPIPLATLPSQEFRSVATNFIKSYAATCLSGAIIYAAFYIYGILMPSLYTGIYSNVHTATDLLVAFIQTLMYMSILAGTALGSTKFAKSLLNAM